MPLHDWTRVDAATFHAFNTAWITHLSEAMNDGVLPRDFCALPEQWAAQCTILGPCPPTQALPSKARARVVSGQCPGTCPDKGPGKASGPASQVICRTQLAMPCAGSGDAFPGCPSGNVGGQNTADDGLSRGKRAPTGMHSVGSGALVTASCGTAARRARAWQGPSRPARAGAARDTRGRPPSRKWSARSRENRPPD